MGFANTYDDHRYAAAYALLEFPGTYYLAFRDLPSIIAAHVTGRHALDFGCGAGRSSRLLRRHGFDVIGVDIAEPMILRAREADPAGDYRLVAPGDFSQLAPGTFDLVLSAFTFDNVPTLENKVGLFHGLGGLLAPGGRIVSLVSSPDIYLHEWASFSTRDFPENRCARSGDAVKILNTAIGDPRPCEDVLWTDEAYQEVYRRAGLAQEGAYRPLARADEPYEWVSETTLAPWVIYVLAAAPA
ncbi:MAG TPA: class I SAM-dependent methyltransferase [Gemmatimonadales bacterium]|nr:class I SAM-dependent methyltransferase [Gemmatimonadales bacterium]